MAFILGFLAAIFLLVLLKAADPYRPYDDSDAAPNRSGMKVRTDYLTGLQYLESNRGHLVPRYNEDGTQVKK